MASMELKCSVCCLTQPITSFSKAARKREEPICKRCTHWGMGVEPEVTPAALQTGHISGEEVRGEVWVEEYLNTRNESQDASHKTTQAAAQDATETESQVESSAAGTCGGVRLDVDGTTEDTRSVISELPSELASSVRGLTIQGSRGLPTHLRRGGSTIASTSGVHNTLSKLRPREESIQEQILRKAGRPSSSASVASGSNVSSISTATTMREARNRTMITFNRWDNTGNIHQGVKDETTASSVSSATTTPLSRHAWPKLEVAPKDTAPLRAIPVVREKRAEREFNSQKATTFCTVPQSVLDDSD
ncbi:unnamed protein product [Clonostachys rhizophaga]|uniref:Stc1 domain-containing protein n=1 Tax=Clonostachys rhizophaga TaxID=160324 RepID=A0A9N9V365_9HYPO|nr:unnamed protein product [Clonostachys rhizophaga]